jgi:hypothetical protein
MLQQQVQRALTCMEDMPASSRMPSTEPAGAQPSCSCSTPFRPLKFACNGPRQQTLKSLLTHLH